EAESLGPARLAVHDDLGRGDRAVGLEQLPQRLVRGAVTQITNVQPFAHWGLPKNKPGGCDPPVGLSTPRRSPHTRSQRRGFAGGLRGGWLHQTSRPRSNHTTTQGDYYKGPGIRPVEKIAKVRGRSRNHRQQNSNKFRGDKASRPL